MGPNPSAERRGEGGLWEAEEGSCFGTLLVMLRLLSYVTSTERAPEELNILGSFPFSSTRSGCPWSSYSGIVFGDQQPQGHRWRGSGAVQATWHSVQACRPPPQRTLPFGAAAAPAQERYLWRPE